MEEIKFTKKQEINFFVIISLFWFAQYVYIPYQTTFLTWRGITGSFIGIIIGAYGISQMLFRLPMGILADSVGRHKYFIMAGTFFAGSASFIRIFAQNGTGFLIANLLSGLASATWISFMVFYTRHFPENEQQSSTGRIIMFNNLGMLLGFLFSTLFYNRIHMTGVCILSVITGLAAFLLSFKIQETPSSKVEKDILALLSACKNKRLWLFAILALIQQGIQLATTMSFTNQILKDTGASNYIIGISSIIYMLSAVGFAGFASSSLCRKKGPIFWIPAVFAVVTVYCILVPVTSSIPVILLLQILPGMSTGILFSFTTSEAMKEIHSFSKTTAMGFFQAVYAIGMTTFPIFTGSLASAFHIRTAYFVLAGIALAGGIISLLFYRFFHYDSNAL